MLFEFGGLYKKYNMKINGILHVGAHMAEEYDAYTRNNITNILWIEGNLDLVNKIKDKHHVLHGLIDEEDNKLVSFNITNNGESSSILELGTHKTEHPHIHVTEVRSMKTIRLDTLLQKNNLDITTYNFLNLDIQGSELHALKSMGNLDHVDYIYTEVNIKELYIGCCLLPELDDFLNEFERVETKILPHKWGDALFIRKSKLTI